MAHLAKPFRDLLGGVLRTADPRRFVVEAMVCAMNADGVIDPRELAVLRRHLAGHELFLSMSPTVADTMVSMATDAITFAGGPHARIPAIARGLPSRIHRLTAYAMACEVVWSDGDVATAEVTFLDTLRQHLRVGTAEGLAIMDALAQRRLREYLEARIAWICGLAPAAADLFALRAHSHWTLDDAAAVRELFLGMPDLTSAADAVEAAFRTPRPDDFHVHDGLRALAASLPDVVDRWWLAAYVLAADPAGGKSWRRSLFTCLLQTAFGLGETDMDLAATEAPILRGTPNQRSAPTQVRRDQPTAG